MVSCGLILEKKNVLKNINNTYQLPQNTANIKIKHNDKLYL